jgi:peptidoglycan/LPS O-acetylase OafA/YrhL
MPRTITIETTLAAWSLVGGVLANIAGFMLIGRQAWPLSATLIAVGTSGLVGAMILVAAADRKHRSSTEPSAGGPG